MKKKLFYIFCLIGLSGFAQKNPIKIAVDTANIRIGEQIHLLLSANKTRNVIFPKLQLDSLGKIEVVQSLPIDTLKDRLEKKYVLTSFDSGKYLIPKQQILVNNKPYFTDSILINVATVKVDTLKQKMYEIKAIEKEPKIFDDYKNLLLWILAALILMAGILYYIFRKKKEKEEPKVLIAPIQEALNRLKELDGKHLIEQNKVKVYYSELTDIIRTYIEKDISIPALESTTDILIDTITDFNESSKLGISKETIANLKEVLKHADLVKFAKYDPGVNRILEDRNASEKLLQNLHPVKKDEIKNELE